MTELAHCWRCGGRIHAQNTDKGEPRLGCYNRIQTQDCPQKSAKLSVYEGQIEDYLTTFHIPANYQERLLESHRRLEAAYANIEEGRLKLADRLKRAKRLYEIGDYTEAEYLARRDDLLRQMGSLQPVTNQTAHLEKLARFLGDLPAAWVAATQEQRNKLARAPFEQVFMEDKSVVVVKPRPELEPVFRINYEEFRRQNIEDQTSAGGGLSIAMGHDPSLRLRSGQALTSPW